jgi:hypothetical protein
LSASWSNDPSSILQYCIGSDYGAMQEQEQE